VLRLDDKDLRAIANSRADRDKVVVRLITIIICCCWAWGLALVAVTFYLHFAFNYSLYEVQDSSLFGKTILCSVFIIAEIIAYFIVWRITSNHLFKQLKLEYNSSTEVKPSEVDWKWKRDVKTKGKKV